MLPKLTLIENTLRDLPDKPGVYEYYDRDGKILYVGKAKNLKKRVSSYFRQDAALSGKIRVLVSKIADIRYVVVDTEFDALLLENNLIKKFQPRYNVMLKDDKTYPWICIKNEPFPRIFPTRRYVEDGSEYFGPYASVTMMKTLLDLIRQIYQYRTCALNLTPANIKQGKFKICLQYHINNCLGPCEGLQSQADYNITIQEIKSIIKGNISTVRQRLLTSMKDLASRFEFEKAQLIKNKIDILDRYQSKSLIVSPTIRDVDVFSYIDEPTAAYVNFIKVINGAIIQSHTVEMKKKLEETPQELLLIAITELRERFSTEAKEIIVPFKPEVELPNVLYVVPARGEKKKLLELSEQNAKYYQIEKHKQIERIDPERHTHRVLEQMKSDLRLKELPVRIECFDNSNIQGAYPVAAMVVFRNAKPDKKEYRHFNIKTVEGPNDFASMEEIIFRRYKRVLEENLEMPQLIVIDGGKGQLSSAMESIDKLGLRGQVAVIGIAKRLEEIFYPGDSIPIYIDKKSETLKIIQRLRDEAHRFGITHHRKRREKGTIKTELTEIEGIGENTANLLLQEFRSVKGIRETSLDKLAAVIGNAKARLVFDYFQLHK